MGGQRSTFRGPMVFDLGGQWSGANGLGGQSSIYPSNWGHFCKNMVITKDMMTISKCHLPIYYLLLLAS